MTSKSIPNQPSNETRTVRPEEAAFVQRPSRRTPAGHIASETWNHSATPVATLTGNDNYFEDFAAGQKMRHARGTTVDEVENQLLTKLVMNSADAHFNEQKMQSLPFGQRLVFGLVTGSIVIGLATQDTAENALAEMRLDRLKFRAPVFHGDTLTAYTEVLETRDSERADAGVVRFKHWGVKQDDSIVFEGEREVLIKRRSHWKDR